MEEKTRQQLLEGILQRFCQVKILHYDLIDDLLRQLKNITTTRGDEERSLLFLVRLAKRELKKYSKARTQSEKSDILRKVLSGTISDLTNHINIYFLVGTE